MYNNIVFFNIEAVYKKLSQIVQCQVLLPSYLSFTSFRVRWWNFLSLEMSGLIHTALKWISFSFLAPEYSDKVTKLENLRLNLLFLEKQANLDLNLIPFQKGLEDLCWIMTCKMTWALQINFFNILKFHHESLTNRLLCKGLMVLKNGKALLYSDQYKAMVLMWLILEMVNQVLL